MNRTLATLTALSSICLLLTACGPTEEDNATANNTTDNAVDNKGGGPEIPDLTNPLADDDAAAMAGATLYSSNGCGGCHGSMGEGSSASNNVNLSTTAANRSDGFIFTVIKEGGPAVGLPASMPAYGSLSEMEIWQLVTHIRTY